MLYGKIGLKTYFGSSIKTFSNVAKLIGISVELQVGVDAVIIVLERFIKAKKNFTSLKRSRFLL